MVDSLLSQSLASSNSVWEGPREWSPDKAIGYRVFPVHLLMASPVLDQAAGKSGKRDNTVPVLGEASLTGKPEPTVEECISMYSNNDIGDERKHRQG